MRLDDLMEGKRKRKKTKLRRGFYGMVGYPWVSDAPDMGDGGGDISESLEDDNDDDPIDRLITACNFSEAELDRATSGFCGTFALALYRNLKKKGTDAHLVLVCPKSNKGEYPVASNTDLSWGHVCVRVDQKYYDIHGRQTPQDMFDNYIYWFKGVEPGNGILLEITETQLILILRKANDNKNAYSYRHLRRWKKTINKKL